MEAAFAQASAIADQRQKIEQYKHILSTVFSSEDDVVPARKFIDHSKLPNDLSSIFFPEIVVFFYRVNLLWLFSVVRRRASGGFAAAVAEFCAGPGAVEAGIAEGDCPLCPCSDSASQRFV